MQMIGMREACAWARDLRIRSALLQIGLVTSCAAVLLWMADNTATNLAARGMSVGFGFLSREARFPISQSVLPYSATDTFAWAFLVGLTNTAFIWILSALSATVLGLVLALARRSGHPLASGLATTYIETTRNTPLVVQLLFWYALITVSLPAPHAALQLLPGVFLTNRGLYLPSFSFGGDLRLFCAAAVPGAAVILGLGFASRRLSLSHRARRGVRLLLLCVAVGALVVGWRLTGIAVHPQVPHLERFNFSGGLSLTPELAAICTGLTLYSAAYISEIIRGGLEAVEVGQWQAARALALSDRQALRYVILPQAMRVIVPPLTSQYVNIAKNSTLALVVGYPDLAFVTATTINQSGQALEGIAILMLAFLSLSLCMSMLMSWYNRRLVTLSR